MEVKLQIVFGIMRYMQQQLFINGCTDALPLNQ